MQKDLFVMDKKMGRILKEDYVGSGQSFQEVKTLWTLYWKVAEHTRILLEGHNKS